MMVLVVDINKGIQTQTAECLVIGEILTENMVVVLNKTDMLKNPGTSYMWPVAQCALLGFGRPVVLRVDPHAVCHLTLACTCVGLN